MSKKRDYKAEYARRIASGKRRGLSRSQSRGHARPGEKPIRTKPVLTDPKLEAALRSMREHGTQSRAAKQAGVSVERLRRFLYDNKLANRQGNQWQFTDARLRNMSVLSKGQVRVMRLQGFDDASINGSYWNAVKKFLDTNDPSHLGDYVGQSVRDAKGKQHFFETDPNELYRLSQSGDELFEIQYKFVNL